MTIQSAKNILRKFWYDPVGSKVIAGIVLFILPSLYVIIQAMILNIPLKDTMGNIINFLNKKSSISNYVILIFLLYITGTFIRWIFLKYKWYKIESNRKNDEQKLIDDGGENPDNIINSPVFFSNRMADAFPGLRGIAHFYSPKKAIKRLEILLKYPLQWEYENKKVGFTTTDPIWWFRGDMDMNIRNFKKLNRNIILINHYRLKINKIIVYSSRTYQEHFVYVECDGEKQIGLYNISESDITQDINNGGFSKEEYGLLNNTPITRQEYDDGSAVIRGKVIDAIDAELRIRFLSKYNFIISSKCSPYNSQLFRRESLSYLNNIVIGKASFNDLIDFVYIFNKAHGKDIIEENNNRINIPMQRDYYNSKSLSGQS